MYGAFSPVGWAMQMLSANAVKSGPAVPVFYICFDCNSGVKVNKPVVPSKEKVNLVIVQVLMI